SLALNGVASDPSGLHHIPVEAIGQVLLWKAEVSPPKCCKLFVTPPKYIAFADSPSSKMFNWPPRAQSVDRDFSYGEGPARYATPPPGMRGQTPDRGDSQFYRGRVDSVTKLWPPISN